MTDIRDYNKTAASNTDLFPEGMAPSAVNDGGRAVQGELAQEMADESGTLTLGGTATAYTLTLNTSPASLSDGLYFSATANVTATGGATTLVVTPSGGSAFASKKIRMFVSGAETDLMAGAMAEDGHYLFQYDSAANSGTGAYILLNPEPATGAVLQRVYAENTATAALSTTIPGDDTLPQDTEGTQILTASITPTSTSSKILVRFQGYGANDSVAAIIAAAFNSSSSSAIAASGHTPNAANTLCPLTLTVLHSPASTSAQTYTIRVGGSAGTVRINGTTTSRLFGGASRATLELEEIKG